MRRLSALAVLILLPACGRLITDDDGQRPASGASTPTDASSDGAATDGPTPRPPEDRGPDGGPTDSCAICASKHCTAGDGGIECDPLVFVTAETFAGDFAEIPTGSGIARLDAACQQSAKSAGIVGKYFMAWASAGSAVTPATRFLPSKRPYWRADGVRVASSFDALVAGALENRITVTAQGSVVANLSTVWTATSSGGKATSFDCDGWSTGISSANGNYGITSCTPQDTPCTAENWSFHGQGSCNQRSRLYCFEQIP